MPSSFKNQASKDPLALHSAMKRAAGERRQGKKETVETIQSVLHPLGDGVGAGNRSQTEKSIQLQKATRNTSDLFAIL